jgi:hypothetical protein
MKEKVRIINNDINEWSDMSTHGLLFQRTSTI